MNFGQFELHTIETGWLALDGGAMFGVVPKNLWNRSIDADEQNRIPMTMRTLVIKYQDRVILVDTGAGNKNSEKFNRIYGIDTSQHEMITKLSHLGISLNDVTDVIQTHLHFDHAGGAVSFNASGDPEITFPKARYYVQKHHWNWATKPSMKDRASFIPQDFMPLQEAGNLELVDGPEELFPGLELVVVNGHTVSQQLVRVRDGERSILYCADLIPTQHHVPAPYVMGYDLMPLVSLEEKVRILGEAVAAPTVLVFEHDRAAAAALVVGEGEKFSAGTVGSLEEVIASL
jgi:glyoxylase-like metal-dependent hydrolase (beta-lactamase superfamily II)